MIFVEEPLEQWLEKYPDLKVIHRECDGCGKPMSTTRPFITKGYVGLRTPDCNCGKQRHSAMTMVTTTAASYKEWIDVLGDIL